MVGMDDYRDILRFEFNAEPEGDDPAFILQLRAFNKWSKTAFYRMTQAMLKACEETEGESQLERWMADGFWYAFQFVDNYSREDGIRKEHSEQYYEDAMRLLFTLTAYFFDGSYPFLDAHGFDRMFEKVKP